VIVCATATVMAAATQCGGYLEARYSGAALRRYSSNQR
jgi:hypothetical protein